MPKAKAGKVGTHAKSLPGAQTSVRAIAKEILDVVYNRAGGSVPEAPEDDVAEMTEYEQGTVSVLEDVLKAVKGLRGQA